MGYSDELDKDHQPAPKIIFAQNVFSASSTLHFYEAKMYSELLKWAKKSMMNIDYKRMSVLTTIFVSRLEDEEGRPCSELFLLKTTRERQS